MVDVAHSTLTGSDLHEPKGIAAATADKSYISNGSGSGTWQKLTANQLTGTGNPFGGQLLHLKDLTTNNTDSGTSLTISTWSKVAFTTTSTNEIAGSSISTSQITLPAGTYYIEASHVNISTSGSGILFRTRLRNVTDSTTALVGLSNLFSASAGGANAPNSQHISGRFTIAGTKTFELQYWQNQTTRTGYGLTTSTSYSEQELWADLRIWKVA